MVAFGKILQNIFKRYFLEITVLLFFIFYVVRVRLVTKPLIGTFLEFKT